MDHPQSVILVMQYSNIVHEKQTEQLSRHCDGALDLNADARQHGSTKNADAPKTLGL